MSTSKKSAPLSLRRESIAVFGVKTNVQTGQPPNSRGECFSVVYNHCGSYGGCKGGPSAGCY